MAIAIVISGGRSESHGFILSTVAFGFGFPEAPQTVGSDNPAGRRWRGAIRLGAPGSSRPRRRPARRLRVHFFGPAVQPAPMVSLCGWTRVVPSLYQRPLISGLSLRKRSDEAIELDHHGALRAPRDDNRLHYTGDWYYFFFNSRPIATITSATTRIPATVQTHMPPPDHPCIHPSVWFIIKVFAVCCDGAATAPLGCANRLAS